MNSQEEVNVYSDNPKPNDLALCDHNAKHPFATHDAPVLTFTNALILSGIY